jgi:hypothetical protein
MFFMIFSFVALAFFEPETGRDQFWPFVDVLREIWMAVTRKVEENHGSAYVEATAGQVTRMSRKEQSDEQKQTKATKNSISDSAKHSLCFLCYLL